MNGIDEHHRVVEGTIYIGDIWKCEWNVLC